MPFGEIEQLNTSNFNSWFTDVHMLGFREVMEEAVSIKIEHKIAHVPSLPGMVILKLIAWSDRPEERGDDLSDILKIIRHYYDLAWDDIVSKHFDTLDKDDMDELEVAAEVLGRDARLYLNKSEAISTRIVQVLERNLNEDTESKIAMSWARVLDRDIEYAASLLKAFHRGIKHEV